MVRAGTLLLLVLAGVIAATASAAGRRVPACRSAQLSGSFARVRHSAGGGLVAYRLVLENVSGTACRVGYPSLKLLDEQGRPLQTTVSPQSASDLGPTVVLARRQRAQETAYLSATYPGPSEPSTGACEPTAYRLRVAVRARTAPLLARIEPPTPVCSKGTLLLGAVSRAP